MSQPNPQIAIQLSLFQTTYDECVPTGNFSPCAGLIAALWDVSWLLPTYQLTNPENQAPGAFQPLARQPDPEHLDTWIYTDGGGDYKYSDATGRAYGQPPVPTNSDFTCWLAEGVMTLLAIPTPPLGQYPAPP
jgi:hypothetical protein